MKRILTAVLLVLALTSWAFAANTIVRDGNIINITFDGATAVDFATDTTINLPNGANFGWVEFKPNAVNDAVSVRWDDASGAEAFYFKSVDGGPQIIYMNRDFFKFYIVGNEASASSKLILHLAP